jgi:transposase
MSVGRPPALSPEKKYAIVVDVLSGRKSTAQSAREAGVSEQSIGNWRRQFLAGGRTALSGAVSLQDERERRLAAEIKELKAALGEAYVQLRLRRQAAERGVTPFPHSRRSGGRPVSASPGSAGSSGYLDERTRGGA